MADLVPPPSNEELAAGLRVAISQTLRTGKSVTFNGRTYTANDLPAMYELLSSLENRINGTSGASLTRVAAYSKGV